MSMSMACYSVHSLAKPCNSYYVELFWQFSIILSYTMENTFSDFPFNFFYISWIHLFKWWPQKERDSFDDENDRQREVQIFQNFKQNAKVCIFYGWNHTSTCNYIMWKWQWKFNLNWYAFSHAILEYSNFSRNYP